MLTDVLTKCCVKMIAKKVVVRECVEADTLVSETVTFYQAWQWAWGGTMVSSALRSTRRLWWRSL